MSEEETENAFAKACAKLTPDEMAIMVQRALTVCQASVESKPKLQKVELPPIGMRLEGPATYLTEKESRIRLQARVAGLLGVKSALAISNSYHTGNTRFRGESRWCHICGEVGHLKQTCPKSPKKRDAGERGQSGGRGCGRGGRRGGRGDYLAACNEKSVVEDTSTPSSPKGNFACLTQLDTCLCDILALASIPTTRSPDWIVNSSATCHVTGAAREVFSYSHLAVPDSNQIADGTAQPVVGKDTVRCTDSVTLTNVLYALSSPVNLASIGAIIRKHKCSVTFDIPKMVFQEKGTGRILGTGT